MSTTKLQQTQKRGYPLPGGATILREGINFSLFSRYANRVALVIDYQPKKNSRPIRHEFELDPGENRTGDMWHILIRTLQTDFSYGYRIDGTAVSSKESAYDYNTILIDPYSRALLPRRWGEGADYGKKPCSRIISNDFNWHNDRPLKTPLSDTIIYELHVRGFTQDPSSGVDAPGTYKGIIAKIPYLKELGITAVELMPITEFDENNSVFHDPETGEKLKDFWGYNPVSFFALNSGYAHDPERAVNEFKTMVLALHQAGIEVFLDMVYNHTGEGGYRGTTSSFRGIDNQVYYLLDHDGNYLNFSGCGNTVNCNHPVARDLIRESLRYWVTEMHIDGFRFDLASILGRDQEGNVLANPPMIEVIGEDPVLRDTKMIAEAWDAAGLYQVGTFSTDPRWGEWNGKFRDDIRSFMLGHDNTVANLATRIAGSSDLYQTSGRSPLSSINFITSHDGFTLYDLVSYNQKHNLPNGERNQDGDNHNLSWNGGCEGPTDETEIQLLRNRRIKTLAAFLLFSQGVPMIRGGDEFGHTQNGNNNAWCQDNPVSWLNWSLLDTNDELFRFFKLCIALRKKHPIFRREEFFSQHNQDSDKKTTATINWQYLTPNEQNWDADCHGLAYSLYHASNKRDHSSFFIMFNGNRMETLHFLPPDVRPDHTHWHKIIDTGARTSTHFSDLTQFFSCPEEEKIPVLPLTCVVLQSSIATTEKGE